MLPRSCITSIVVVKDLHDENMSSSAERKQVEPEAFSSPTISSILGDDGHHELPRISKATKNQLESSFVAMLRPIPSGLSARVCERMSKQRTKKDIVNIRPSWTIQSCERKTSGRTVSPLPCSSQQEQETQHHVPPPTSISAKNQFFAPLSSSNAVDDPIEGGVTLLGARWKYSTASATGEHYLKNSHHFAWKSNPIIVSPTATSITVPSTPIRRNQKFTGTGYDVVHLGPPPIRRSDEYHFDMEVPEKLLLPLF